MTTGQDGSLLLGTHHGIRRVAEDGTTTTVGPVFDAMGLTRSGRRLLASGHPGPGAGEEPFATDPLGLVASVDEGRSWQGAALSGEVDLHLMASHGKRVLAYDGAILRLSTDGGATWAPVHGDGRAPVTPESLAVDGTSIWVAGAGALYSSGTGGSWQRVQDAPALAVVAGAPDGALWGIDPDGGVRVRAGSAGWERVGVVGSVDALLPKDRHVLYLVSGSSLTTLRRTGAG